MDIFHVLSSSPNSFHFFLPFLLSTQADHFYSVKCSLTFANEQLVDFGISGGRRQRGLLHRGMPWCAAIVHMGSSNPALEPFPSFSVSWSIDCLEIQLYFKTSDSPLYLATSSPLGIDNVLTLSHNGNFLMNIWCCEINKDENSPTVEAKKWIIKMFFSHNPRENPVMN